MPVFEVQTKKWGNSLGVLIPRNIVRKEKIRENQKVDILLLPRGRSLKRTFGMLKVWKTPAQKIKEQIKRDLYGK